MKKLVLIFSVFLMTLTCQSAFADDTRCLATAELDNKITQINDFVSICNGLDEVTYFLVLNNLNESSNEYYTTVHGCDEYTDEMLEQMKSAVINLLENAEKYRSV